MRFSRNRLRKIIREELESTLEDVEAKELDADEQADGLEDPIDYAKVMAGESNVTDPEVLEIIEKLQRRLHLKRIIREVTATAEEDMAVVEPPTAPPEQEERAGASASSLRAFFQNQAAMVNDLGISDPQIPALVAAVQDLIIQAQSGTLKSREDRVRKSMAKA